jgi:tRNA1Val (adenine37-N6)-methyltransferase
VSDSDSDSAASDSLDAISGRLYLEQPPRGSYRFGLDALLLATDLPPLADGARVVDLGAGHGAVALSIAARERDRGVELRAVERQETLVEMLRRNVVRNGLEESVEVVVGDLREHRDGLLAPHSAELVVANPPFRPVGRGRISDDPVRAAAHVELFGTLGDFLSAAAYVLVPRGWCKMIVPPRRLRDLFAARAETDLDVESLRFVHTRPGREAYLVEVVLRRGGTPEISVAAPLLVHQGAGPRWSREVARRVAGAARRDPSPASIEAMREAHHGR